METKRKLYVNFKKLDCSVKHRTDTLVMYYNDVKKYPILSIEDEERLFDKVRNGTPLESNQAKTRLINCNLRFVIAVAKKYATSSNLLDLINEGNMGLIEALDTYEPDKGAKFSTWAIWYIRKYITVYLNENNSLVKNVSMPKIKTFVRRFKHEILKNEGREATNEEIAEMLNERIGFNVTPSDVAEYSYTYLDKPVVSEQDGSAEALGNLGIMSDTMSNFNDIENTIEKDNNKELISNLFKKLTEREIKVIKLLYGIDTFRQYTVNETAKELGLTVERIRQMKNEIIAKLIKEIEDARTRKKNKASNSLSTRFT